MQQHIQDYVGYTIRNGIGFELYVRGSNFDARTHITGSMEKFLNDYGVLLNLSVSYEVRRNIKTMTVNLLVHLL